MNIETANRLYELRKKYGYSQEELASKLGLSRQAVSKWERAEASPDTDNLVELAKLYGISLDELLNLEKSSSFQEENPVEDNKEEKDIDDQPKEENVKDDDGINLNINDGESNVHLNGSIHISDDGDEVHIGRNGIHVESKEGDSVHIGLNGIHIKSSDGKNYTRAEFNAKHSSAKEIVNSIIMPLTVFGSLIAYILLGFFLGGIGWASYWVLFLLIPINATIISAIFNRKFCDFCFPVLVAGVYCFMGLRFPGYHYTMFGVNFTGFWHPWWFLFLTIPVYYCIFDPIDKAIRHSRFKHGKINVDEDVIDEEDDD